MAVFLMGCSSGCSKNSETTDSTQEVSPIHWTECGYDIGDHACDFTLTDQSGNEWNLYSHYGDIIILDFSTEWCGYCHVAAEETQAVHDEHKSKGFQYATIMVEDFSGNSPPLDSAIQRWVEHYGITSAPVLAGNRDMIDSGEGGWPVTGWPTFYILNDDLVIVEIIRGYSAQSLDNAIQSVLNPSTE